MYRRFRTLIILQIITLIGFSCIKSNKKNDNREAYLNIYRHKKIIKTDTLYTRINDSAGILSYEYSYKNNLKEGFRISKEAENDSFIKVDNHLCPLVGKKTMKIDSKEYELNKYYYNIEDIVDEETTYIFNNEYGVLINYNDGWHTLSGQLSMIKLHQCL